MENRFPVMDWIGLVEEINAEYKQSSEPLHAAICYEKCEHLLSFIPKHGHFFIAHTHLILALLKNAKDPLSITLHLQTASHQIRTLQSHPLHAPRLHLLDPLTNAPHPDILLLEQYFTLVTSLYNEQVQFFSPQKWKALEIFKIGESLHDKFKLQTYQVQVLDAEGNWTGAMRKFHEPMHPLVAKTASHLHKERCERMDDFWRFMGRELMKGKEGSDVRMLGGAHLVGLGGKGVFEFWEEIKAVWLRGYGGYGGVGEEGGLEVFEESCVDCGCFRCGERARAEGKVFEVRKVDNEVGVWEQRAWEREFVGYSETSGCGYLWDF